ncbi:MAG: hypothetical protein ABW047_17725, partial [Nitrospiraceae bacterium]
MGSWPSTFRMGCQDREKLPLNGFDPVKSDPYGLEVIWFERCEIGSWATALAVTDTERRGEAKGGRGPE